MMRKRVLAWLAMALVVLGTIAVTAAPAQANDFERDYAVDATWDDTHWKECHSNTYISACIQPYGDYLWVKDNYRDGNGVRLTWENFDSDRYGDCIDNLGADRAWTQCNKNFAEGDEIRWFILYTKSDGDVTSDGPYYTTV